jgi:hypothetical protein
MAKRAARSPATRRAIPDADSVARFCAPVNLDSGRPTGAAFQTRPRDQGRLSCAWVECVAGTSTADQQLAVRENLSARVAGYDTAGRIAVLHAGAVRALIIEMQRLDVLHAPTGRNECHAVITGVEGLLELTFAELLADLAAANTIEA